MIKKTINNEQGFVLVASLMILLVLMIIGIAATNTTTIELQISGNDKLAKQNFYAAESAAYEGAQRLENEGTSDQLRPSRSDFSWLLEADKVDFLVDELKWQATPANFVSALDGDMSLVAISLGRVKGKNATTLKITAPAVYGYSLLGRSTKSNSQKIIEIGYRKRF